MTPSVATDVRVTRIGAYALCHDEAGRVLLCRLAPGNCEVGAWTLPGGGLDFGEDPEAATLRELTEETGLVGEIEALAGLDARRYPPHVTASGHDLHAIRIVYRVRVVGGTLRHELGGSTDRAAWMSPDELAAVRVVDLVAAALAF